MSDPSIRRGRVLVIDDDPIVATAMRRVLATENEVVVTNDGPAALDLLLGGESFDVVLCDLAMQRMTGIELYDTLALAGRGDLVDRIAFVTGGAYSDEARAFLASIPNVRFEKPLPIEQLRAYVRGVVRSA